MSRTFKDKPYKARQHDWWPYGYITRWNDCAIHEKLCSCNSRWNKSRILQKQNLLLKGLSPIEIREAEEEIDFLLWFEYELIGNDYDIFLEESPTDDQLGDCYYTLNDGTCIVFDSYEDDMYWDEKRSYPCSATIGERLHAMYLRREMEKVYLLKFANWI